MDQRLSNVIPADARAKWSRGEAVNFKEFAVANSLTYEKALEFKKEESFPMLGGLIWPADFTLWRQTRLGLIPSFAPTPARRRPSSAGRS